MRENGKMTLKTGGNYMKKLYKYRFLISFLSILILALYNIINNTLSYGFMIIIFINSVLTLIPLIDKK